MSFLRGSSILSDIPLKKATHPQKNNILLDLAASTFSTLISYIYSDIVFAITLHFMAKQNDPNSLAGLGIAFTIVNIVIIPMALGTKLFSLFRNQFNSLDSLFSSIRIR